MTIKTKLFIFIFVILTLIIILIRPYYLFLTQTLHVSPIRALLSIGDLKSYSDHVNILFLGIAPSDGSHEGPNLSDSIIVISYDLKTNHLTTISIPRDVWSTDLHDKINSAYAYGLGKNGKFTDGFNLAKAEVSTIIGQPVHYAMVVDFNQFEELIDFLGGVDVNVDNSFVDKQFPIAGKENDLCNNDPDYKCRYQTISFTRGLTHMDGKTALNFVRSRHAIGSEGSDFAREKRQQKVVEALKNKLLAYAKNPDVNNYKKLYQLVDRLVKRDIGNQEMAILIKDIILKRSFQQDKIVLADDFFVNPTTNLENYGGLWTLVPKGNDIKFVQNYIDCRINQKPSCEKLKPK